MLQLKNIVKTYGVGDITQNALDGVSVQFRENEFVSILGQSGSGKTTMLNIIGGLDRYTDGDLIINGVSTKEYKDSDWDYYRNHSIGFVFQSYNLIPHQTVLANVELALTLAGVSKKERRERAIAVLGKVGLSDHIHKKPNQMSGGQMQRVAIARALINNPDILLADEPTGALDSETSIQIMELLKEIAKDKLVIMVTHNPELAERYSTRIVRLRDGQIIDDSNPYTAQEVPKTERKKKKISMSFGTALSLSFNNLRTKKGRTLLTSFAGSIGIIGIALILSFSTGIQAYVNSLQSDTLSSYPLTIYRDDSSMMSGFVSARDEAIASIESHDKEAVYSNAAMYHMFNAVFADDDAENNLTAFRSWIEQERDPETAETELFSYVSAIQYQYDLDLNTYVKKEDGSYQTTALDAAIRMGGSSANESGDNPMAAMFSANLDRMNLWSEMLPGANGELISDLLYDQYDLVYGAWPEKANEIVLVLDGNNEISDIAFYVLGRKSAEEVNEIFMAAMRSEEISFTQNAISYEDVLSTTYRVVPNAAYYSKGADGKWMDMRKSKDESALNLIVENGYELQIVGILRPNPDAASTAITGTFGYTSALTDYLIAETAKYDIVKEQKLPENENYDVLTGLPFVITENLDPTDSEKAQKITEYFSTLPEDQKVSVYTDILSVPPEEYLTQTVGAMMQQYQTRESMIALVAETYGLDLSAAEAYLADYSEEKLRALLSEQLTALVTEKYAERAEMQIAQIKASASTPDDLFGVKGIKAAADAFDAYLLTVTDEAVLAGYYDVYMPNTISGSTLSETLRTLGCVDPETPASISIYAKTFEDKENIDALISEYNDKAAEEDRISYTDYVALLMSGVTTMINAISYGLIGFVSVSLIVSSIMIGIITYISVLERTKEIGILRSVGASKKDISRVFNAETMIIGLTSGLIGIGVTVVLNIFISILAKHLTGISNLAILPWAAGVILVLISVGLTLIAGLIPSRVAAKKDPVIALRSE